MFRKKSFLTARVVAVLIFTFIGGSQLTAQINPQSIVLQPAGCQLPCKGQATVTGLCAGDYTFQWTNSSGEIISTDSILTNACEGQYTVIVSPAHGGCICGTLTVYIPSSNLSCWPYASPQICNTQGTLYAWVGGGIPPYNVTWTNSSTGEIINTQVLLNDYSEVENVPAGNYTIKVEDSEHCESICWVSVNNTTSNINLTFNGGVISCGETSTSLSTTISNGTAPYTYQWSTGSTASTLTNIGPGTYTVTVKDVNGCTKTATKIITAPTQPVVFLNVTNTVCGENNGKIVLSTNSGASQIIWNGPGGFTRNHTGNTDTLNNLAPGAYNVTVTNSNGCSAVNATFVADSDKPSDKLIRKTICQPDTIEGIWVSEDLDTMFTVYTGNCSYNVDLEVTFLSGTNTTQQVNACSGMDVVVNGITYTKDTTFTTNTNACLGTTTWNISFSLAPDTISLVPLKICGGTRDTIYSLSWPIQEVNGCISMYAKKEFQISPYTFNNVQNGYQQICGLIARIDTIAMNNISVDNQTCVITSHYNLLETILPSRDSIIEETFIRCGLKDTIELHYTHTMTNLDSCFQKDFFTEVVYEKAEIMSEVYDVCSSQDSIIWNVNGRVYGLGNYGIFDSINCIFYNLDVNQKQHVTLSQTFTVCPEDQITYQGQTYGKGEWEIILSGNEAQCDTTLTLTVIERQKKEIFVNLQACAGESVLYKSTFYPIGLHFTELPSQHSDQCDTLVTLFVSQIFSPDSIILIPSCTVNLQDSVVTKFTAQGCAYKVTYTFLWQPLQQDSIEVIQSCNDSIGHLPNEFTIITTSDGCDQGLWKVYQFIAPNEKSICEQICWGKLWQMPNGSSITVTDTITYIHTLPGANGQCDTTINVMVTPMYGDTLTLTLPGVCDISLSGTRDTIMSGNSCPILVHMITPLLNTPQITVSKDSISCAGNDGAIISHIIGGSGEYDLTWIKNGQMIANSDTAIYGLNSGYYSLSASDIVTGCETTTYVELMEPECTTQVDTLPCRWKIYPNPATAGQPLYLELEGWTGDIYITFRTPDGGSETTPTQYVGTGQNQLIQLNTPTKAGVWFLTIRDEKHETTGKIIVHN